MLYQVSIRNFKRISSGGIFLKNLTWVNYFIGENGSGKSSILQAIYSFFSKTSFPEINLSKAIENHNIWLKQKKDYKVLYINQNPQALLDFAVKFYSKQTFSIGSRTEEFRKKLTSELLNKYNYSDWGLFNFSQEESLDSHENYLQTIEAFFSSLPYKPDLILIETPENSLHPSLEKKLPLLFKRISLDLNCQIFVATHSPFVVSSSGAIQDEEKDVLKINRRDFVADQKVYLIKDGQTASKRGEVGIKESGNIYGSDGYWGKKIGYIAAKMLGTGLEDFIVKLNEEPTKNAPTLIFCEGEGKDEDARIYNQIFKDKNPRVLFVSSKSNSQTEFSFDILEDIKEGLSGNFKILMLRDRDHEFPKIGDLISNQEKNLNHRVLFRRAIEAYIYTSEAAENLLKNLGLILPENLKKQIDALQKKVQLEAENGKLGHDYKERFITLFKKVYKIASSKVDYLDFEEFKFDLIKQIKPESEIYYHLEKDIFKGFV